jgi:predicted porin
VVRSYRLKNDDEAGRDCPNSKEQTLKGIRAMEVMKRNAAQMGTYSGAENHSAYAAREAEVQRKQARSYTSQQKAWFNQSAGMVHAALLGLLLVGTPVALHAQATDDKQALQERVDKLTKALAQVQERLDALEKNAEAKGDATAQEQSAQKDAAALRAAATQAAPAAAPAANGSSTSGQATPQPVATGQAASPVAPGTRPGSTTPSVGGVSPAEVYNLTLGANQPTTAEQAHHKFFERKPGKDLTFYTKTGEITVYGNLDVSVETATKGIRGMLDGNGNPPVGNVGWLEDISTNLAYVGVRGTQMTGIKDTNFIYQLETGVNISAAPGIHQSNSQEQDTVDGTLFTRNSYLGLGMVKYGALLIGKTDPPYKQSTARMNPFSGMEGDYQAIMGNTGGDNRVEFGGRLDHSIWYTSPNLRGYQFNVFMSPGQNRASDSDNIAAGESDCTGGDNPGDGGGNPIACNDASFSDAVSGNLSYTREPLYVTVAYERHMKVNRQGDVAAIYAAYPTNYPLTSPITISSGTDPSTLPTGYTGQATVIPNSSLGSFYVPTAIYNADVADEDAAKVGIQYGLFNKKTIVSAIFEDLHRYMPGYMQFQNERSRLGSWLSGTQAIGAYDSLSMGWARAYRTPGDPGQHNTSTASALYADVNVDGDAVGGRGANNEASLTTIAYRHKIGEGLEAYTNWAGTFNDQYAHYDLGAGGRGVTTDCHDAFDAASNEFSDPHCWAGGHLKAFSMGLDKRF